jgi:AAA domain, putative AbiEii toxin, Type IV TA system
LTTDIGQHFLAHAKLLNASDISYLPRILASSTTFYQNSQVTMAQLDRFVRVDFSRFKAFDKFALHLRHFNILVGPNNSGKSTILAAFRILAAAMRRANTRGTEPVEGPQGQTFGYAIDLSAISVAEENIFYNYDDSQPATVTFRLSNKTDLLLYFRSAACVI